MNLKPDETRLVSLTNYEIVMMIDLLRKVVPSHLDEANLVNVIHKLRKTIGQ